MSQDLIAQLRSPDANTRKQAIIELGRSLDERALPALKYIYQNDPVPALRELALKAGKHIRKNAAAAPAPAQDAYSYDGGGYDSGPTYDSGSDYGGSYDQEPAPVYDAYSGSTYGADDSYEEAYDNEWRDASRLGDDVYSGSAVGEQVSVSAADKDRAKQHASQAFQQHMDGNTDKAANLLGKALDINPNLLYDQPTQNLAAEITKLPPEEAIAVLEDPERRKTFMLKARGIVKQRKGLAAGGEPTWGDVGMDIAILFMVSLVSAVIMSVVSQIAFYQGIDSSAITGVLFGGAVTGAYLAFSVLVNGAAAHFAAKLFGGIASITESYHALIPGQAIWLIGAYVWLGLVSFFPQSAPLACFGPVVLVVGGIWLLSSRLAAVHDFGAWTGCMSMVIGSFALGLILFVGFNIALFLGLSFLDGLTGLSAFSLLGGVLGI